MPLLPSPLTSKRILVTNDDSIHAEGIRLLTEIAHMLTDDVVVVAPESEQSGVSHSLTLRAPLRIKQLSERCYSVNGTPTDCVALAVKEILKVAKPDLILSGINHGSNLGEDVTYSGTVAAAMEGTLLGIPSLALSQAYSCDDEPNWDMVKHFAPHLIIKCYEFGVPENTLFNINFPDRPKDRIAGIKCTPQGKRKIGDNITKNLDPEGRPYYWIGAVRNEDKEHHATDLAAIRNGYIALTPLCLDLTHYDTLNCIDEALTTHFHS